MKHTLNSEQKQAVAAILDLPVETIPDELELTKEEILEEDEDNSEDEEEDEDEPEDDEEDEEEDDEEDEDEVDEEDDDAEDSAEDVELLRLKDEWQKSASTTPFSEFLKSRGK